MKKSILALLLVILTITACVPAANVGCQVKRISDTEGVIQIGKYCMGVRFDNDVQGITYKKGIIIYKSEILKKGDNDLYYHFLWGISQAYGKSMDRKMLRTYVNHLSEEEIKFALWRIGWLKEKPTNLEWKDSEFIPAKLL